MGVVALLTGSSAGYIFGSGVPAPVNVVTVGELLVCSLVVVFGVHYVWKQR